MKRSVLVIEQDRHVCGLLRRVLEHEGIEVRMAPDGVTGLEDAQRQPPDLVLLDVQLPGLDGWAVLGELRANPRTQRIPVVMMSALFPERGQPRLPVQAVLSMPFSLAHLRDVVQRSLRARPSRTAPVPAAPPYVCSVAYPG